MTGKTLPTLYKRTSTGAVQTWRAEIVKDKYRTISGQQDGKHVISAWTVPTPKNVGRSNATTQAEQAEAEVAAMYTKKRERGYTDSAGMVDSAAVFQPMLAKKFEDYADTLIYPVYAQPKLDGIRCIARRSGLFSRNGKPITSCPHIEKKLVPFFQRHPTVALDGELYADKLKDNFNEICSLVKRTKPSDADRRRAEASVEYWIYDVAEGVTQRFGARSHFLGLYLFNGGCQLPLVRVETREVAGREYLDSLYEDWLAEGMEGQIVRRDAPYENKRTDALLKRKEFQDMEFRVLDVLEGIGNRAGTAGKMKLTDGNVRFESNIKGDMAYLRQLLKDRKRLIGATVTVKFFNLTPAGIPRFPFVVAVRDYE